MRLTVAMMVGGRLWVPACFQRGAERPAARLECREVASPKEARGFNERRQLTVEVGGEVGRLRLRQVEALSPLAPADEGGPVVEAGLRAFL